MVLSFFCAYLGFAALSLSKNRHYQQVWPGGKLADTTENILSTLGWVAVALSSFPIFHAAKTSIAITEFLGVLSIAALLLILQFSYAPRTVAGVVWGEAIIKFLDRFFVAKG